MKKALWTGNRTLTRVLTRRAPYTTPSGLFPAVVVERPTTKNLKSHRGGTTEGILSSFPHPHINYCIKLFFNCQVKRSGLCVDNTEADMSIKEQSLAVAWWRVTSATSQLGA